MNRFITGLMYRYGSTIEKSDTWSSSKVSSFVPFISLFTGETLTKGADKTLLYSLPVNLSENPNTVSKYLPAVNHMADSIGIKTLSTTRSTLSYQITKGMLNHIGDNFEVNPLIVLCVKSDAIYSLDKDNLDAKQFCLVINTDVFKQEHALMSKNMRKYYVDILAADGIDILYTSDIKKWLFNPVDYIPKFNTVSEMVNHLDKISSLALDIKIEDEDRGIEIIDDTLPF